MINDYFLVEHTSKKYYNANTVIFNVCLTKHFVTIKSYEGVLKSFYREEKMKLEKVESKPSCIGEGRFLMLMKEILECFN